VPTKHYLNLNYLCNEHCVFCASDRTNSMRGTVVRQELTLEQIKAWITEQKPRRGDDVMLAGGEPTLHRQLFEIVRAFGAHCKNITIFTNGVKLADRAYAHEAIVAGISNFQIALFGSKPETHDAITRRPGSFHETIAALNNLADLRPKREVVVRLLVARQCFGELPDIVRAVDNLVRGVDTFSINRLILSNKARVAGATVSWAEAGPAINEAARLIREYGYELCFWPVPLCVFRGDNATFVEGEVRRRQGQRNVRSNVRYLDSVVVQGESTGGTYGAKPAQPVVCETCPYQAACGGIEDWYYERFGTAGIGLEHLIGA
jgi:MoaA/NifB/PqqE/SkfB family radical SAM enzyme